MKMKFTARQRLAPFGHISRLQDDKATYDMSVKRDVAMKLHQGEMARAEALRARLEAAEALLRKFRYGDRQVPAVDLTDADVDAYFARYAGKD